MGVIDTAARLEQFASLYAESINLIETSVFEIARARSIAIDKLSAMVRNSGDSTAASKKEVLDEFGASISKPTSLFFILGGKMRGGIGELDPEILALLDSLQKSSDAARSQALEYVLNVCLIIASKINIDMAHLNKLPGVVEDLSDLSEALEPPCASIRRGIEMMQEAQALVDVWESRIKSAVPDWQQRYEGLLG